MQLEYDMENMHVNFAKNSVHDFLFPINYSVICMIHKRMTNLVYSKIAQITEEYDICILTLSVHAYSTDSIIINGT